jgi:antitoxin CptB
LNELEKKILWQCRRGLWELDAILVPFVEQSFNDLNEEEIDKFRKFLSYEDIEMFDILVNKKGYEDQELESIIERILNFQISNLGGIT